MRRKAALLIALSLLSLSCNREKQRRIAVIPKGTSHVFWQAIHAGANAAGKEFHEEILWDGPPNETDYSRQLEIVDSMLNRHVDGMVVAAADRTTLNASLDRAARENIPVVIFDSGVDSSNYVSFVATDNYSAGPDGGTPARSSEAFKVVRSAAATTTPSTCRLSMESKIFKLPAVVHFAVGKCRRHRISS